MRLNLECYRSTIHTSKLYPVRKTFPRLKRLEVDSACFFRAAVLGYTLDYRYLYSSTIPVPYSHTRDGKYVHTHFQQGNTGGTFAPVISRRVKHQRRNQTKMSTAGGACSRFTAWQRGRRLPLMLKDGTQGLKCTCTLISVSVSVARVIITGFRWGARTLAAR